MIIDTLWPVGTIKRTVSSFFSLVVDFFVYLPRLSKNLYFWFNSRKFRNQSFEEFSVQANKFFGFLILFPWIFLKIFNCKISRNTGNYEKYKYSIAMIKLNNIVKMEKKQSLRSWEFPRYRRMSVKLDIQRFQIAGNCIFIRRSHSWKSCRSIYKVVIISLKISPGRQQCI